MASLGKGSHLALCADLPPVGSTRVKPLVELHTERLWLRAWRDSDVDRFAEMNADPRVMAHMPGVLNRDETLASIVRIRAHFDAYGYGLWAAELARESRFVGYVGLAVPPYETHFTPCVEVGWRFAADAWGNGYATEGARAAIAPQRR